MRGLWFVLLASACSFKALPKLGDDGGGGGSDSGTHDSNGGTDTGGSNTDAAVDAPMTTTDAPMTMPDAPVVPPDAQQCFGSGAYRVCLASLPTNTLTLNDGAIIDTATSTACLATQPTGWTSAGQPASCFIVAANINISNLRVVGTRPLVLVATNNVSVTGLLDAASHPNLGENGPGAPSALCSAFQTTPSDSTNGAGGGAGGSFITRGGSGGFGNFGGVPGGTSALADVSPPTVLRAGCSGQTSGTGSNNSGIGGGGTGGGALYIVAGGTIALGSSAKLNVSGQGGYAPVYRGGGGGGGSGGMIALYAPSITASGAKLVANGGAGSTGAQGNSVPSPAGPDPDPNTPGTSATGVAGVSGTGIGGNGWSTGGAATNGAQGSSGYGGGGGGGGGGYIQTSMALSGAITSPAVTVVP